MFVVGGESLVDLVSQPQAAEGGIPVLHAHAGGSPYNCAMALAKLGNESGYLCPFSKDGLGDFLFETLAESGAQALLGDRVSAPSTLAVVTIDRKGQANYEFYRGADRALNLNDMIAALPPRISAFQIGGFCAIEEADWTIWNQIINEASARGALISIDPNVRPSLVEDFDAYLKRLNVFLDKSRLVKISTDDLEAIDAEMSLEAHVQALLKRPACELVVVTDGENGSRAFNLNGSAQQEIFAPEVFGDTVGAGDSLMAGILTYIFEHGHENGLGKMQPNHLSEMLRFGAVVAGLNCGEKGCHPPTRAQVDQALQS